MRRIVFVTGQVSPFQIELAQAVNDLEYVEYKVLFCRRESGRPLHWLDLGQSTTKYGITVPADVDEAGITDWAVGQLRELDPDILSAVKNAEAVGDVCVFGVMPGLELQETS